MREIKFRAWHKQDKVMYTINDFRFIDNKIHYVALHLTDDKSILIHMYDEPIILMQYTGLKDKNDIEIYEGDIVTRCGKELIVRWDENETAFHCFEANGRYSWGNVDFGTTIIGNIYENPELLEAK